MSRPLKIGLLVAGVVVFFAISAGLARILSASDAERSLINAIVRAEARGDAADVAARITGCSARPACVARARADAAALRRAGAPKLLRLDPTTRFVLGGARGMTRVAWAVPGRSRPVVQCFTIRRTGDVVSGMGVEVTDISRRIPSETNCKGMKEGI